MSVLHFILWTMRTVDLERLGLNISFGFSGTLLLWLRSFLSERSFCVFHGPSRSLWVSAPYALPQGSVLGPLLYIIYTYDLASLLDTHAVLAQLYADDVQAYQHALPRLWRRRDRPGRAMSIAMEVLGPVCRPIGSASTPSKLSLFRLAPASSWLS